MLAYTNKILYFCVDKSNVIMKMKRRFLSIVFGMLFFMPLEIIADPAASNFEWSQAAIDAFHAAATAECGIQH